MSEVLNIFKVPILDINTSEWKAQNNSVSFSQNLTVIKGDNGVGKSTIMKAWCWLLTGFSDAFSNKNANLFDDSVPSSKDRPLAVVEAHLIAKDGNVHLLKRTAKDKWTRKKGTDEYVKEKSDEYKTYIDEVEYNATDFDAWLCANICDTTVLKYCIDGNFFLTESVDDKKKMRTFLATVVGDVSNDELTGEYDDLFAVLAQQPNVDLDIIEKQYRALVQNTKKRKDEIPALIESEQYRISSYDQTYDFVAIQNGIDSETATIQQCDNQLIGKKEALQPYIDAQTKAIEERTRRQQALDNARTTHDQQNAQMRQQYVDAIAKAQKANASVDENNRHKQQALDFKKHQLEAAQRDLELCQQKRLKLKEAQAQVKARVFTEDKCAYCGQTLPEEAQEAARQRFNEKKEADNRAIVVKGRANNEDIALYQKRVEELSADIAKGIVFDKVQDLTALKAQLDEFDRNMTLFEDTETFDLLFQQVNAVVIPPIPNQDTDTIVQMKNEAMERLKSLNQQMGVRAIRQKCVETVESLKAEQQELEATAAGYEKILIQLKHYRQEKMEVISRRVNEHLEYASIQMFSVQKDGTIVPDLIIKDKDGISYSTTNGASRILMAVDMQRFFCEKNGIQMPVWIDEASIINPVRLAYLNGQQVIKLMFADCPLTVEKY